MTLDAILLPCDPREPVARKRAERAAEELRKGRAKLIVVSGGKTPNLDSKYQTEARMAYGFLKENGIAEETVVLEEESQDTIQNVINSLRKVDGENIGVVSNPSQIDRVREIVSTAKKEGLIRRKVNIHRITTQYSLAEILYELPARFMTRYRLSQGICKMPAEDSPLLSKTKSFFMYLTGLFA